MERLCMWTVTFFFWGNYTALEAESSAVFSLSFDSPDPRVVTADTHSSLTVDHPKFLSSVWGWEPAQGKCCSFSGWKSFSDVPDISLSFENHYSILKRRSISFFWFFYRSCKRMKLFVPQETKPDLTLFCEAVMYTSKWSHQTFTYITH